MAADRDQREPAARDAEARPAPDEVELEATPQPEREEPVLPHVGPRDLSKRDYLAILRRAAKESLDDQITDAAAAVTYYTFLAIPALLLVAVGLFSLVARPGAVQTIVDSVATLAPAQAVDLLEDSLERTTQGGGAWR